MKSRCNSIISCFIALGTDIQPSIIKKQDVFFNPWWYWQMCWWFAVYAQTWLQEENAEWSWMDWFSEQAFERALTAPIDFRLTALLEVIIGSNEQLSLRLLDLELIEHEVKGSITTHFNINAPKRKRERKRLQMKAWIPLKVHQTVYVMSSLTRFYFNKVIATGIILTSSLFLMFSGFTGSFWRAGGVWGSSLTFWPAFLPTVPCACGVLAEMVDLALAGCFAATGILLATAIGLALDPILATALTSTAGFCLGWRLFLEIVTCCSWCTQVFDYTKRPPKPVGYE